MLAQFQRVANTYLTRRSFWVVAALVALACTFALVAKYVIPDEPVGGVWFIVVAAFSTGFVLALHAKWQFCHPRARLVPGFTRPHIAPLAVIIGSFCVAYPVVLAQATRWSLLGVSALMIAGAAAGVWVQHRPRALTIVLAFVISLSCATTRTINLWVLPDSTPAVTAGRFAILALAWGSIWYWLYRLSTLREEDVDYLHLPVTRASCAGRTLAPDSLPYRLVDALNHSVPYVPATTTAGRQRLLRDGLMARPLWVRAASMAAIGLGILATTAFIGISSSAGGGLDLRENTLMLGVMIFMTAAMGNGQLATRRPCMSQELMLPLRRQDYFDGLFASSAQYAFLIWITTQAAIVAYVALFMPDYFFPGFLAVITALSLGFHMCMFGVQTSIARKNSSLLHLFAFMIILFPAATPVILALKHLPRPVASAAERKPLIQKQYAESYKLVENHLPPGKQMPPEMSQKVLETAREIVSLRLDGPPVKPYVPWACATLLAAAGVAAFLDGRKRWLNLELG